MYYLLRTSEESFASVFMSAIVVLIWMQAHFPRMNGSWAFGHTAEKRLAF